MIRESSTGMTFISRGGRALLRAIGGAHLARFGVAWSSGALWRPTSGDATGMGYFQLRLLMRVLTYSRLLKYPTGEQRTGTPL
jgi:hypothetical protein